MRKRPLHALVQPQAHRLCRLIAAEKGVTMSEVVERALVLLARELNVKEDVIKNGVVDDD